MWCKITKKEKEIEGRERDMFKQMKIAFYVSKLYYKLYKLELYKLYFQEKRLFLPCHFYTTLQLIPFLTYQVDIFKISN